MVSLSLYIYIYIYIYIYTYVSIGVIGFVHFAKSLSRASPPLGLRHSVLMGAPQAILTCPGPIRGNHLSNTTCLTHAFFKSGEQCAKLNYDDP